MITLSFILIPRYRLNQSVWIDLAWINLAILGDDGEFRVRLVEMLLILLHGHRIQCYVCFEKMRNAHSILTLLMMG